MAKLQLIAVNALRKLGQDIRDARRRRRIPMTLLAERAGILAATLSKIEKGVSTVSMGAYAAVLFSLGLTDRLRDIADANYDTVGRMLEEEHLPKRIRLKKSKSLNSKGTKNAQ
jgi:transcriptional regulator with XRE-family HTH domain